MAGISNNPSVLPAPEVGGTKAGQQPDRRASHRIPFTAAAEVVDIRSQTRVGGRCSDIGRGGCYVDTLSPFSAGTAVTVRIERDSNVFEAAAVVAYAQVPMGMGLGFTEVKPEHQALLHSWIGELTGEKVAEPQPAPAQLEINESSEIENLRQVLNDLINLMVRNRLISEEERSGLLRRIFR
jgi:hypothetical protein